MRNSSQAPWSNNSNAPQISSQQYHAEKVFFAGVLLKAMSCGIIIALFFQCMVALLDPGNRTKWGIKWGFVAHTVAMFLIFTMTAALGLQTKSILYVDDRNSRGNEEIIPGALGYRCYRPSFEAIDTASYVAFPLNQWLADGLLLYRCHIIYSMDYRVITLPCLLYVVSIVLGIAFTCLAAKPKSANAFPMYLGDSYYSVSLSLSVILTLMIIVRLILHRRNVRKAIGVADSAGGLYTAVITMLVESYALYFVTFILFFAYWATGNWASELFAGVLSATQVIAPYLVILRVAQRRALTSDMTTSGSGRVSSIRFRSQGTENSDNGTPSDEVLGTLMEENDVALGELGVGVGNGVSLDQGPNNP